MLKKGVAVLGESYGKVLAEGLIPGGRTFTRERVKTGGAYCDCIYGVHPFVLLNYQNNLTAHSHWLNEMGHAMHFYYSDKTSPSSTPSPPFSLQRWLLQSTNPS